MQGFTTGHLNILWVVLTNKFSDSSQKENKWVPLGKTWDYYRKNGHYTLRQQLLMMHGIACYCIVLHGIAWVLHDNAWYWYGIAWYCMVWHGITWYCMVLHGIA